MIYEMKLIENEFNNVKYNGKIIEVRLNDCKRKLIHKNDIIKFDKITDKNESILVNVEELFFYSKFEEVYSNFPKSYFGYKDIEIEDIVKNIYKIYTKKEEQTNGVIAIKFKKLAP